MIDLLSDPKIWVSFLTLTALELVLGIDNVIFISILLDNFPRKQREFARIVGLSLAMLMRIGLLFVVSWIDAVFSLDSIITAVGMVEEIEVIIAAVVTSVAVLIACAAHIGRFVTANPSIKMLALSFLVVIGVVLIADGFDHHVPKGYIYFSLAFAVCVEMLNIGRRKFARRKGAG